MVFVRFRGESKSEGRRNHFPGGFRFAMQAITHICVHDRVGVEFQVLRDSGSVIGTFVVTPDRKTEVIKDF